MVLTQLICEYIWCVSAHYDAGRTRTRNPVHLSGSPRRSTYCATRRKEGRRIERLGGREGKGGVGGVAGDMS